MKLISKIKLLQFLKGIDNYTWIEFKIDDKYKIFITIDIDGAVSRIDCSDNWYYEKFKGIVQNKFNSHVCSPPLDATELKCNYKTYFTLKELLKWQFLKQYESALLCLEEDILFEETISINENDVELLLNTDGISENLRHKLLRIKLRFDKLHSE